MAEYRLKAVLQLREQAKEAAEQAFAVANQELHKAKVELKRLGDLAYRESVLPRAVTARVSGRSVPRRATRAV